MKLSLLCTLVTALTPALCNPIVPAPSPSPTCTTTLTEPPAPLDLSPTTTIYKTTVTKQSKVDCHDCALAVTTGPPLGHGPARIITATVTKQKTTTTEPVCSPTPVCKYCIGPEPMET